MFRKKVQMKQILITCDTEVGELHAGKTDAFEIFIKGETGGMEVGVKIINDLASEYGGMVEHFLDVYPYERYGEDKFKRLCQEIISSGHGINLHTHPSGKYDKNRKFMWQYSLDEQIEIIKFGKQKIKEWVGIDVIAHRAGGYGANNDTLVALKINNILIDSSFFYKNVNCDIEYRYVNRPSEKDGILQLPVSVFEKQKCYAFLKTKSVFQKFDFRYGSNADEILKAINLAPKDCIIILFLHSFNFLNLKYDFKNKRYVDISVNESSIDEYKKLLGGISSNKGCEFTSIKDLNLNSLNYIDYVPSISVNTNVLKSMIDKFRLKFMHIGDI